MSWRLLDIDDFSGGVDGNDIVGNAFSGGKYGWVTWTGYASSTYKDLAGNMASKSLGTGTARGATVGQGGSAKTFSGTKSIAVDLTRREPSGQSVVYIESDLVTREHRATFFIRGSTPRWRLVITISGSTLVDVNGSNIFSSGDAGRVEWLTDGTVNVYRNGALLTTQDATLFPSTPHVVYYLEGGAEGDDFKVYEEAQGLGVLPMIT